MYIVSRFARTEQTQGFPDVPDGFALDIWHSHTSLCVESEHAGESQSS